MAAFFPFHVAVEKASIKLTKKVSNIFARNKISFLALLNQNQLVSLSVLISYSRNLVHN